MVDPTTSFNSSRNNSISFDSKSAEHIQETQKTSYQSPPISSSAAQTGTDGNKKFIRTADLKFKVNKVSDATYAIESIVSKFSGYVTYTKLESRINRTTNTKIALDTIEEIIHYDMFNDITIRIPNYNLDTTLKALVPYIEFLNHRIIKANNVTLQILASQLEEERKKER